MKLLDNIMKFLESNVNALVAIAILVILFVLIAFSIDWSIFFDFPSPIFK